MLEDQERADHVDLERPPELVEGHLRQRVHAQHAGVGEHQVQPAEQLRGLVDDPSCRHLVGHVDGPGVRGIAAVLELRGELGGGDPVLVGEHDLRTLLAESSRRCRADATPRAGHDRAPALERADAARAVRVTGLEGVGWHFAHSFTFLRIR